MELKMSNFELDPVCVNLPNNCFPFNFEGKLYFLKCKNPFPIYSYSFIPPPQITDTVMTSLSKAM